MFFEKVSILSSSVSIVEQQAHSVSHERRSTVTLTIQAICCLF